MTADLFFIPLIQNALRQPDPRAALAAAFELIRRMGSEPRYRSGYEQFLKFVETAAMADMEARVEEALAQLRDRVAALGRAEGRTVEVECDGKALPSIPCEPGQKVVLHNALPGFYTMRLDTGWVIWEGAIGEEHLLWAEAFPGQPLRAAADTGEPGPQPTLEVRLLEDTLAFRVYAGVEAGTIEIQFQAKGARQQ